MSPHRGGGVGVKEAEDARLDMIAARCCILIYISYMYLLIHICVRQVRCLDICAYMFMHTYVCLQDDVYMYAYIYVNVYMYVDVYI